MKKLLFTIILLSICFVANAQTQKEKYEAFKQKAQQEYNSFRDKANGSEIKDEIRSRELSFKDFQKWLVSCQTKDKDMKVKKHLIEIRRK